MTIKSLFQSKQKYNIVANISFPSNNKHVYAKLEQHVDVLESAVTHSTQHTSQKCKSSNTVHKY